MRVRSNIASCKRDRAVAGAGVHLADQRLAHAVAELRDIAAEPRVPERLRQDQPDRLGAGEIVLDRLDDRAQFASSASSAASQAARTSADSLSLPRYGRQAIRSPARSPSGRAAATKSGTVRPSECGSHGCGPGHRLQHQRGVHHGAGHRRDVRLVAEPVRGQIVRHQAQRLLEPDDAAARRRDAARPAAVGADADRHQPRRHRSRRAAARPAAGARQVPRVGGAAEQRRLGEAFVAEFRGRGLADEDRAGRLQPRHRGRIAPPARCRQARPSQRSCAPRRY